MVLKSNRPKWWPTTAPKPQAMASNRLSQGEVPEHPFQGPLRVAAVHRQEREVDAVGGEVLQKAGIGDAIARVVEAHPADLQQVAEEEVPAGRVNLELLVGGGERIDPHPQNFEGCEGVCLEEPLLRTPREMAKAALEAGTTKRHRGLWCATGARVPGSRWSVWPWVASTRSRSRSSAGSTGGGILRRWGKRLPRYFSARVSER